MFFKNLLQKLNFTRPNFGMRTFKTWMAATVTAAIGLSPLIGNPFYALMGTIFGIQNTVSNSLKLGMGRILGTAVGAFIGFVFAYFELNSPIFIGFAVAIVIITCDILNIRQSTLITVTLCLLIMFNPVRDGGLLFYTFRRTVDTALGVIIAIVLNRFISPPNHFKNLILKFEELHDLGIKAIKNPELLTEYYNELNALTTIHTNFRADERFDSHIVNYHKIAATFDACKDLYYDIKYSNHTEAHIKKYHENNILEELETLKNSIIELKGDI